jgi:transcriptional regulator with GAF, ATPase, and Fis domain
MFAWIGTADLNGARGEGESGVGPIANALAERNFERAVLLSNFEHDAGKSYVAWAQRRTKAKLELRQVHLSSPTDYEAIYRHATTEIARSLSGQAKAPDLTFHISPGTPAMGTVWIILAKSKYTAELIESSKQKGVQTVTVPFELAADFIPTLVRGADAQLAGLQDALQPLTPEFNDILHRSPVMKDLLHRAARCAAYSAPVLIEGESGTGKEMLARAIHKASPRSAKPFIVLNCGAIPSELVESEFFGHEKGAFTGAIEMKRGRFEEAHEGTLFLDEIGDLPLRAQVKLLRTLQEGTLSRVGSTRELKVDVRLVAATHRDLADEVAAGRFREDLFYRLAVLVLRTPPLRDRAGDVGLLIQEQLRKLNEEESRRGRPTKSLSAKAKNVLLQHAWPGNVRELNATLMRAVVWARGGVLSEEDVRAALGAGRGGSATRGPDGPIEEGFNLKEHLDALSRRYIERANAQSPTKKAAAELLGFKSPQALQYWIDRLRVET